MDSVPSLNIDVDKIPKEVETAAGLIDNRGRPSLHGPGRAGKIDLQEFHKAKRLQERIWEMAAALTKHYVGSRECTLPTNMAFMQVLNIVQSFIDTKVKVINPANILDAFLSPYYGYIIDRLHQGIRPDDKNKTPELPRYERMRDAGSTADVDFWTRRKPYAVKKSHINAVVPDTKRLEQSAAWRLDRNPTLPRLPKTNK